MVFLGELGAFGPVAHARRCAENGGSSSDPNKSVSS